MSLTGSGRVLQVEKGRTLLYVSQLVAKDSAWPFKAGETVALTLDPKHKRLVVEKTQARGARRK